MYTVKIINSQEDWENFILANDQASFLQSFNWGKFHQDLGHQVIRLAFFADNKQFGACQLIKIKAKRGTYLECPAGPVVDWSNIKQLNFIIESLAQVARSEKATFIRIRPNVAESPTVLQQLKISGFVKAPMHLHAESTWVLDLQPSLDQLMASMRKNTRYAIKKAIKLGVTIEKSTDPKDIDLLFKLQQETVQRHKFVPFSLRYFQKQFQAFVADDQIQLFKASYQGQVLAVSFIIFYGHEAVYHYSGSTNRHRDIPASYLLQWEAIQSAKSRGLATYNFWGITKDDNPKHRFAGVTLFKKGFGGRQVNFVPAHDLPIGKLYYLTYLFETLRRILRRL